MWSLASGSSTDREAMTKNARGVLGKAEGGEVRYFFSGAHSALLPAGDGHLAKLFALWGL